MKTVRLAAHDVPLIPEWTTHDTAAAQREGWGIFNDGRGPEIQKIDSAGIFRADSTAIWHCVCMADVSRLHARALTIHFHNLATRGR